MQIRVQIRMQIRMHIRMQIRMHTQYVMEDICLLNLHSLAQSARSAQSAQSNVYLTSIMSGDSVSRDHNKHFSLLTY